VNVVCYQVVSATGWSFVQRSPTVCGVSECDRVTSQRRPRPKGAVGSLKKDNKSRNTIDGVSVTHKVQRGATHCWITRPSNGIQFDSKIYCTISRSQYNASFVAHLVQHDPAFYGMRRFITVLTKARQLLLSWARRSQSTLPSYFRSILILICHLWPGIARGFFFRISHQNPARFISRGCHMPHPTWLPLNSSPY
jgi:hypothetical protein